LGFKYYELNQPINYRTNPIIYLINIFYKIYEITTKVTKKYNKIYVPINEEKMEKLYTIRTYKNFIFDLFNNNNKINKKIEDKFDILLFVLESKEFPYNIEEIMNSRIKYDNPLTKSEIEKFINDNRNEETIFNLNNCKLKLKYQKKEYEFNYRNYNKLLFEILRLKDEDL
jgi:hypothetical protein